MTRKYLQLHHYLHQYRHLACFEDIFHSPLSSFRRRASNLQILIYTLLITFTYSLLITLANTLLITLACTLRITFTYTLLMTLTYTLLITLAYTLLITVAYTLQKRGIHTSKTIELTGGKPTHF